MCDEQAVRVLVEEGPERVRELERLGTKFDRRGGKLILGSEGAHSVPRVVHAGGDATGSVVASALAEALASGSSAELHEDEFVIDLLTDQGRCVGAVSLGEGGRTDGDAWPGRWCWPVGAPGRSSRTRPTRRSRRGTGTPWPTGQAPLCGTWSSCSSIRRRCHGSENPTLLVTEALRGEGAYLLDDHGERFMVGVGPPGGAGAARRGGASHQARHGP